jgi:hypothetical protein
MPLFLACVLHVVPIVLRLLFCRCLSVAFVVLFFGLFDVWHSVLCVCVFSVCFVVSGETNMQKFCDLVNWRGGWGRAERRNLVFSVWVVVRCLCTDVECVWVCRNVL